MAPLAWYERYAKRIEDSRLPKEPSKRDAYAQTVGEDGFLLLDALESPEAPETLRTLPCVATLRQLWQDHYERQTGTGRTEGTPPQARSVSRSHGNYHGRRCTSNLPMMLTPATAPKAAPSGRATWSM